MATGIKNYKDKSTCMIIMRGEVERLEMTNGLLY